MIENCEFDEKEPNWKDKLRYKNLHLDDVLERKVVLLYCLDEHKDLKCYKVTPPKPCSSLIKTKILLKRARSDSDMLHKSTYKKNAILSYCDDDGSLVDSSSEYSTDSEEIIGKRFIETETSWVNMALMDKDTTIHFLEDMEREKQDSLEDEKSNSSMDEDSDMRSPLDINRKSILDRLFTRLIDRKIEVMKPKNCPSDRVSKKACEFLNKMEPVVNYFVTDGKNKLEQYKRAACLRNLYRSFYNDSEYFSSSDEENYEDDDSFISISEMSSVTSAKFEDFELKEYDQDVTRITKDGLCSAIVKVLNTKKFPKGKYKGWHVCSVTKLKSVKKKSKKPKRRNLRLKKIYKDTHIVIRIRKHKIKRFSYASETKRQADLIYAHEHLGNTKKKKANIKRKGKKKCFQLKILIESERKSSSNSLVSGRRENKARYEENLLDNMSKVLNSVSLSEEDSEEINLSDEKGKRKSSSCWPSGLGKFENEMTHELNVVDNNINEQSSLPPLVLDVFTSKKCSKKQLADKKSDKRDRSSILRTDFFDTYYSNSESNEQNYDICKRYGEMYERVQRFFKGEEGSFYAIKAEYDALKYVTEEYCDYLEDLMMKVDLLSGQIVYTGKLEENQILERMKKEAKQVPLLILKLIEAYFKLVNNEILELQQEDNEDGWNSLSRETFHQFVTDLEIEGSDDALILFGFTSSIPVSNLQDKSDVQLFSLVKLARGILVYLLNSCFFRNVPPDIRVSKIDLTLGDVKEDLKILQDKIKKAKEERKNVYSKEGLYLSSFYLAYVDSLKKGIKKSDKKPLPVNKFSIGKPAPVKTDGPYVSPYSQARSKKVQVNSKVVIKTEKVAKAEQSKQNVEPTPAQFVPTVSKKPRSNLPLHFKTPEYGKSYVSPYSKSCLQSTKESNVEPKKSDEIPPVTDITEKTLETETIEEAEDKVKENDERGKKEKNRKAKLLSLQEISEQINIGLTETYRRKKNIKQEMVASILLNRKKREERENEFLRRRGIILPSRTEPQLQPPPVRSAAVQCDKRSEKIPVTNPPEKEANQLVRTTDTKKEELINTEAEGTISINPTDYQSEQLLYEGFKGQVKSRDAKTTSKDPTTCISPEIDSDVEFCEQSTISNNNEGDKDSRIRDLSEYGTSSEYSCYLPPLQSNHARLSPVHDYHINLGNFNERKKQTSQQVKHRQKQRYLSKKKTKTETPGRIINLKNLDHGSRAREICKILCDKKNEYDSDDGSSISSKVEENYNLEQAFHTSSDRLKRKSRKSGRIHEESQTSVDCSRPFGLPRGDRNEPKTNSRLQRNRPFGGAYDDYEIPFQTSADLSMFEGAKKRHRSLCNEVGSIRSRKVKSRGRNKNSRVRTKVKGKKSENFDRDENLDVVCKEDPQSFQAKQENGETSGQSDKKEKTSTMIDIVVNNLVKESWEELNYAFENPDNNKYLEILGGVASDYIQLARQEKKKIEVAEILAGLDEMGDSSVPTHNLPQQEGSTTLVPVQMSTNTDNDNGERRSNLENEYYDPINNNNGSVETENDNYNQQGIPQLITYKKSAERRCTCDNPACNDTFRKTKKGMKKRKKSSKNIEETHDSAAKKGKSSSNLKKSQNSKREIQNKKNNNNIEVCKCKKTVMPNKYVNILKTTPDTNGKMKTGKADQNTKNCRSVPSHIVPKMKKETQHYPMKTSQNKPQKVKTRSKSAPESGAMAELCRIYGGSVLPKKSSAKAKGQSNKRTEITKSKSCPIQNSPGEVKSKTKVSETKKSAGAVKSKSKVSDKNYSRKNTKNKTTEEREDDYDHHKEKPFVLEKEKPVIKPKLLSKKLQALITKDSERRTRIVTTLPPIPDTRLGHPVNQKKDLTKRIVSAPSGISSTHKQTSTSQEPSKPLQKKVLLEVKSIFPNKKHYSDEFKENVFNIYSPDQGTPHLEASEYFDEMVESWQTLDSLSPSVSNQIPVQSFHQLMELQRTGTSVINRYVKTPRS